MSEKLAANILSSSSKMYKRTPRTSRVVCIAQVFHHLGASKYQRRRRAPTLYELGSVVFREEKDKNRGKHLFRVLNIFSEQTVVLSLQLGADDVARIRDVLVQLGKSTASSTAIDKCVNKLLKTLIDLILFVALANVY